MRYCLIFAAAIFAVFSASAREVQSLDRGWKFFAAGATSSDGARTVDLPHSWNTGVTAGGFAYASGSYEQEVDIPARWSGKRIFVKCYGAGTVANVFVNGRHAGEHRGAYTAFTYEISGLVRTGERNTIRIAVSNSPRFDVLPTAGDMNPYGGLFRGVELIVTGEEIISPLDHGSDGVFIRQKTVNPKKVEAEAVIRVGGVRDNTVQAAVIVTSAAGDTVASNSARVKLNGRTVSTATVPFTVSDPRLWDGVRDPHLYTVHVEISSANRASDRMAVRTGFRHFSADARKGFTLNGKPYPLRGVFVTQDRAAEGPAITEMHVREDVGIIRSMGANAVRVTPAAHHPLFYDLCDEAGIIVWSDFPLIGAAYLTDRAFVESEAFRQNGTLQATEIIRQQFNHPCIAMWGVFSDIGIRGDSPLDYISQLNMLAKREDPSRLTACSSNEDGNINFITDLVSWNQHLGWREGLPSDVAEWAGSLRRNWKDLRSAVSYGAGASVLHQGDSLRRPPYMGAWHPERWQTHLHEEYLGHLAADSAFWGIFAGNMFDYGAAGRTWGEGRGVNDTGLVTFDRKYLKDAYYLYKAAWNRDEPFVYIAERRWDNRSRRSQDIKVYSSLPEVVLTVNGVEHEPLRSDTGIFLWKNVKLQAGENVIGAHARGLQDAGAGQDAVDVRVESDMRDAGDAGNADDSVRITIIG